MAEQNNSGVGIERIQNLSIVSLKVSSKSLESARDRLKLASPVSFSDGAPRSLWFGPDRWLLVSSSISADSLVTINHYKNLLNSEGIPAFIRNEHLGGILGEMPFQEVWPELWVENDLDHDRALQLIDSNNILQESPQAAWRCRRTADRSPRRNLDLRHEGL